MMDARGSPTDRRPPHRPAWDLPVHPVEVRDPVVLRQVRLDGRPFEDVVDGRRPAHSTVAMLDGRAAEGHPAVTDVRRPGGPDDLDRRQARVGHAVEEALLGCRAGWATRRARSRRAPRPPGPDGWSTPARDQHLVVAGGLDRGGVRGVEAPVTKWKVVPPVISMGSRS